MKIAKLVTVSITTRVIVDVNSTEEQIMEKALPNLTRILEEDGILDHLETITPDTEIPFGKGKHDNEA